MQVTKLTVPQVLKIREQAAQGRADDELAKEFNVTQACIRQVRLGLRHARVGGPRTSTKVERTVTAFGGES